MSPSVRFALPLAFGVLTLMPLSSSAQMRSLLPQTPSQNLTPAKPPYVPVFTDEGDSLTVFGRKTKGYHVMEMPLTFLIDPSGVNGILRTYFQVNNRLVSEKVINSRDRLPAYAFPRKDARDTTAQHIIVAAKCANDKTYSMTDCLLYSIAPDVTLNYTAQVKQERGVFEFANRDKLGKIFCYINHECIGEVNSEKQSANCDLRHLPVGKYRLAAVAETKDGSFLPYKSFAFAIEPRYDLQLTGYNPQQTITVPIEEPDSIKLKLHAARKEPCSATTAHVYVDSDYLGDVTPDKPDIVIPLRDVPSGDILLEVIPVGEDELEYPEETLTFTLKNAAWEQRTYSTSAYQETKRIAEKIRDAEKRAAYWMGKAEKEPAFTWQITTGQDVYEDYYGTRYTLPSTTFTPIPGKLSEYLGKAREAITEEAQLCLQNAQILRKLHILSSAKKYYKKAIYLYGSDSANGKAAKQELDEMLRPKRLKQDEKKG